MIHHFKPDHYFNTLGSHAPVLSVESGDTVVTTCVDAWGQDERGKRITASGNPMSGPFYVNGAKPGQVLSVTLDRITPNRPWGWVRTPLAYNVVEPDFVQNVPARDQKAIGRFKVDLEANTATFDAPGGKLGKLVLPLSPMPGCFGVAPAGGEAISTATSGPHGGNMDYNGFVAGVTVYFPVFVEGALFHIGDGHAVQGDGEISGTGIEISTEVQVTLRVIKRMKAEWPRGENAEFIFAVGNARPLDQALQHATTEMARWLRDGYGLDGHDTGILMGQAVKYDIGNVFDPAYTVVCKIPKVLLPKR